MLGGRGGKRQTQKFKPCNVSFYDDPPLHNIDFDKFKEYCDRRLKLLRLIENYSENANGRVQPNQIKQFCQKTELIITGLADNVELRIEEDRISHFLLRVGFSRTDELQRWFIRQECILFKNRLLIEMHCKKSAYREWLKNHKHLYENDFIECTQQELQDPDIRAGINATSFKEKILRQPLKNHSRGQTKQNEGHKYDRTPTNQENPKQIRNQSQKKFYKSPFEKVPWIARTMQAYMKNGFVYLEDEHVPIILQQHFKKILQQRLNIAQKHLTQIFQDERIRKVLLDISRRYVGDDFSKTSTVAHGKINLGNINAYAKKGMPLCMKQLHNNLKSNHHLRHFGRLQFGLFLKGIGLSMKDALQFWKREFTKKMSNDKFQKEYAYNIRHSYGKEGKRTDYTPWSCGKIMKMGAPGKGEYHGCPFKNNSLVVLQNQLRKYGLSQEQIGLILREKKLGKINISCLKMFQFLNPGAKVDNVGNHPNAYFKESFDLQNEKIEKLKTNTKKFMRPKIQISSEKENINRNSSQQITNI